MEKAIGGGRSPSEMVASKVGVKQPLIQILILLGTSSITKFSMRSPNQDPACLCTYNGHLMLWPGHLLDSPHLNGLARVVTSCEGLVASPKAFSKYGNESRFQKPSVLLEHVTCEVVGFGRWNFCPVSPFGDLGKGAYQLYQTRF